MHNTTGWLLDLLSWGQKVEGADGLFFIPIQIFLHGEIKEFQANLFDRVLGLAGAVALTLLTIWILVQGYRIVTGQSRESMMALVTNSLRATLIVGIATGLAAANGTMYDYLTDGVTDVIYETVSGKQHDDDDKNMSDIYQEIDESLLLTEAALASIDAVQTGGDDQLDEKKTLAKWFAGFGTSGPAITAGTMLLLNQIAMALFIGLGPMFILCLLFDSTKPLFQRWLLYGIGTLFSLALLSVMVTLAMRLSLAVAATFWVDHLIDGAASQGVNTMAMQQGGLGLILTMLIISAPPMAASFFQGTLGSFTHYSAFGGSSANANNKPGPQGQPPGSYQSPPQPDSGMSGQVKPQQVNPKGDFSSAPTVGQRGLAGQSGNTA